MAHQRTRGIGHTPALELSLPTGVQVFVVDEVARVEKRLAVQRAIQK